jgi:hypothetical protein
MPTVAHPSQYPARHRASEPPRLRFPLFLMLAAVVISIILIAVLILMPDMPALAPEVKY